MKFRTLGRPFLFLLSLACGARTQLYAFPSSDAGVSSICDVSLSGADCGAAIDDAGSNVCRADGRGGQGSCLDAPVSFIFDATSDMSVDEVCPNGQTDCSGVCVSLESAEGNCGRCAHSCLGGACSAGACQPVVVADRQNFPLGVAPMGSSVYWSTFHGGVLSAPVSGGAVRILVDPSPPVGCAGSIVAAGGDIFWITGNGQPTGSPVAGGPPVLYGDDGCGNEWSTSMAVDSSFLYWISSNTIFRTPLAGGSVTTVVNATGLSPASMAVGSSLIFWTETWWPMDAAAPGPIGVRSAPVNGVDAGGSAIVNGLSAAGVGIAVDSTSVYWNDRSGAVWKATLSGGGPVQLATGPISPSPIVIDDTNVYWLAATTTADGSLLSVPLAGGTIAIRAQGVSFGGQLAVDEVSIYFTNLGSPDPLGNGPAADTGRVWRVAK
jgi:hypothetical protein